MEHSGDCLSNTEALEGRKSHQSLILVQYTYQTQDNEVGDPSDDWVLPPSPPAEDRQPKRSKLDGLVEVECAIKPLGFSSTRTFNPNSHPPLPPHRGFPQHDSGVSLSRVQLMDHAARLARLERTKAEAAAIIAAAAAAQKEAEERAFVEAAAAAEEQTKEEERNAERERRRKGRKERERGEKRHHDRDPEDNREKRLLKLVGAVVVKTMSKYRTRMDVDTFKKHAKEVRGFPTSSRVVFAYMVQLTHIIAEKEKKSSSYKDNKLDALSDEKKAKIKKFAREYIHKVLHRLEKGKRRPPDSGSGASAQSHHHDTNTTTPSQQGEDGGDAEMEVEMEMSVEEAMDLSADEDEPNGVDMDADGDEDDEPTPVEPAESDTSTAVASVPTPSSATAPADPRLRARTTVAPATATAAAAASFAAASVEAKEKGWEMLGLSFESSTTAAS
jgi:hypothetical protein